MRFGMSTVSREELHRAVERLPEERVAAAAELLDALTAHDRRVFAWKESLTGSEEAEIRASLSREYASDEWIIDKQLEEWIESPDAGTRSSKSAPNSPAGQLQLILLWSPEAFADLAREREYLRMRNPVGARNQMRRGGDGGCVGAGDHGPDRAQVTAHGPALHQGGFAFQTERRGRRRTISTSRNQYAHRLFVAELSLKAAPGRHARCRRPTARSLPCSRPSWSAWCRRSG
jgi:hypothetical protein